MKYRTEITDLHKKILLKATVLSHSELTQLIYNYASLVKQVEKGNVATQNERTEIDLERQIIFSLIDARLSECNTEGGKAHHKKVFNIAISRLAKKGLHTNYLLFLK